MIVDLEQLKKARLAVGTTWTRMSMDNALSEDILYVNKLLLDIIMDIEQSGESIIEKGGEDDRTD